MKKVLFAIMLIALVSASLMADVQQPVKKYEAEMRVQPVAPQEHRDPPAYTWVTIPQDLITSFYDYMPGSYCSNPVRLQYGPDGGAYLAFHATETASSNRRAYMSYIENNGGVYSAQTPSYIGQTDIWEGYVGIDIDRETGDPFTAWHVDYDSDNLYEIGMAYDVFHLMGGPGLVSTPIYPIDNEIYGGVYTPYADDEFIWPYIYIMNAPSYDVDGMRRLIIVANNYVSHDPSGNPSENILLAYTDFSTTDIEIGTVGSDPAAWNYVTMPLLDFYNSDDPTWGRYNKGWAVTDDGKIAMIGYLGADDLTHEGNALLVFYNDNYCEGDWTVYQEDSHFVVDMPMNQDGTPYFTIDDPNADIFFDFVNSSHPMAMFDAEGKLHFFGNMVLGHINPDGEHMLWAYFSFAKEVLWDPVTQEARYYDIYPQGEYPDDGQIYLPWDENADGQIDDYWDEEEGYMPGDEGYGNVRAANGWPIWWHGWDEAFHENTYKMAANHDEGWLACVWHDGLRNRFYNDAGDEDFVEWDGVPEIMISLSADNGLNWSEPISLNANETPELAGMTVCYAYPGDEIVAIDDMHGVLHLMFFDDNTFGSSIQGQGAADGGMLKYAAIEVDFSGLPDWTDAEDEEVVPPSANLQLRNYPNPFNPTTNVSFNLPAKSEVEVNIYNIRGELVKTLFNGTADSGNHTLTWNGDNNDAASVSSGVYFCRVTAGDATQTTKMLMLK